jgi:hypothetical protein
VSVGVKVSYSPSAGKFIISPDFGTRRPTIAEQTTSISMEFINRKPQL